MGHFMIFLKAQRVEDVSVSNFATTPWAASQKAEWQTAEYAAASPPHLLLPLPSPSETLEMKV